MDYPGRIPGQIIENLLYYYTEPFDLVVDPMAGGGTTIDVCKAMYRRYRAYDISPVREDITKHDATTGFLPECKDAKLIFMDPPYWKQKRGEYSKDATNVANLDLQEFYSMMDNIFLAAKRVITDSGYLAVIIGPTQEGGKLYDHAFKITKLLEQHYKFINRIIVPYTTQQHGGAYINNAKENRNMLYLYRDLVVFQNG
jgi:DNA modification methylase